MIISGDAYNKFMIRNRKDLTEIKTVEHNFGCLYCGLCYPEQMIVVLGINNKLVEFNYEQMIITKYVCTYNHVYHIEKVSDDNFLTGEMGGHIKLINFENMSCLSQLKIEGVSGFH